jgi:transposase
MKKVLTLTKQQRVELEELYKNGKSNRVRRRSHLILLSNKEKPIRELCDIFELNRDTVSDTIENYNNLGIKGLFDKARSGRPSALTEEEEEFVLREVAKDSRNLKKILSKLKNKFNKKICKATLIRFLRKKNLYGNDFVSH